MAARRGAALGLWGFKEDRGSVKTGGVFYYLQRKDDVSHQDRPGFYYQSSWLVRKHKRAWDISHTDAYRQLSLLMMDFLDVQECLQEIFDETLQEFLLPWRKEFVYDDFYL